jgi:hypothetical protein
MFEYISSPDSYDSRLVSDFLGIMSSCLPRPLCKAGKGFPRFSISSSLWLLQERSESVGESSGDVIRPQGYCHNRVTVCTTYSCLIGVALRANELAVELRSQAECCRAK